MDNNHFDNYFIEETNATQQPTSQQEHTLTPAPHEEPSGFRKIIVLLRKLRLKVWIPIAAAVLVLAIAIPVVIGALTNTYKTPMDLYVSYESKKEVSQKDGIKLLNGFSEKEVTAIYNILRKSDRFKDFLEESEEFWAENVERLEDEYGENYKFSYEIDDKEELDRDDLKEFKSGFKEAAKSLKEAIEATEDFDSGDWDDVADELDLSKSEAKKLVKALEDLCDVWKSVDVTEGYELTTTIYANGDELDGPEELNEEYTVHVYKVNGRWVMEESLGFATNFMFQLIYFLQS